MGMMGAGGGGMPGDMSGSSEMGGSNAMSGMGSDMGMVATSGMPGSGWPTVNTSGGIARADRLYYIVGRSASLSATVTVGSTLVGPSPDQVRRVGHSLFTLLFAGLGGLLARWFYEKRERPQPAESRSN